jgi:hypothetical protein
MWFRPTAAHSVTHGALAAPQDMPQGRNHLHSSFWFSFVFNKSFAKPCLTTFHYLSLPLTIVINCYDFFESAQNAPSPRCITRHPQFFLDHQICWTVWLCDSQQVNPLRRLLSSALVEHHMLKQCQDKRDKTCSRCCAKHIETHRNTVYIHTKPHCLVTQQSHTEQNGSVTGHRLWHSE